MDSLSDFTVGGLVVAAAAVVWRWFNRNWMRTVVWAAVAWIVVRSLLALRKLLKIAKTREQRAYAVAGWYSIVLGKTADIVQKPEVSDRAKSMVREIDKQLVGPMVQRRDAPRWAVVAGVYHRRAS